MGHLNLICHSFLLFVSVVTSNNSPTQTSRQSRQFVYLPPRSLSSSIWPYQHWASQDPTEPFYSVPRTEAIIDHPLSIEKFLTPGQRLSYFLDGIMANQPIPQVQQQGVPPLALVKSAESRFRLRPIEFFGSCKNNWVESVLDRCCDESKCEAERYETITLCQDVPSPLFGAALSSSPNGRVEGFGSLTNGNVLCGAYVMARSPYTRVQISCPTIDLATPNNIQIYDGATIQPVGPFPEKNVVYTSSKSVGFLLVNFTRPEDKFSCEWKAIL